MRRPPPTSHLLGSRDTAQMGIEQRAELWQSSLWAESPYSPKGYNLFAIPRMKESDV
jgi:hypothetical protein